LFDLCIWKRANLSDHRIMSRRPHLGSISEGVRQGLH
jgi:hypothetical protein